MDEIIKDILTHGSHIEAIYLYGSHANNENRYDSDIDLAVFVNAWICNSVITQIKKKHSTLDLTILDANYLKEGISRSPSIYINPINQIILNKQLVYGNDIVLGLSIPRNKIIKNQLYFTLYSYFKLLKLNNIFLDLNQLKLLTKEEFLSLNFHQKFKFQKSYYYSYKELNTLVLTLCSYRLIINKKFQPTKAGKSWFIKDYLKTEHSDQFYQFIKEYSKYINEMKTFVFDNKSRYLESKIFKEKIFNILYTYLKLMK